MFDLDSSYDALALREDGRFAVAYHSPFSDGGADRVLFNPNELTIIDLSAPEPTPRVATLQGAQPTELRFAPPFTLTDPDSALHMAYVFAPGAVSLLDLTTDVEADRQRRIPLAEPALQAGVSPLETYLSPDDPNNPNDLTLYVSARGVLELFAIDLLPADPATGRTLQPAINQISAGITPGQLHPYTLQGREKLLVVPRGSETAVSIIDAATGNATRVSLERPVSGGFVWEQVENGEVRPQALLYGQGDSIAQFVDLTNFERQGTGAVRALQLGDRVAGVEPIGDSGSLRAVARHATGFGLDVIDLEGRRVAPIPSTVNLQEFVIAGDMLFTVSESVDRLLAVDLTTQAPAEITMMAGAAHVVASTDGGTLLVDHGRVSGWYSLFNTATFQDGPADQRVGVRFEGLLDEGIEQEVQ